MSDNEDSKGCFKIIGILLVLIICWSLTYTRYEPNGEFSFGHIILVGVATVVAILGMVALFGDNR